MLHEDVLEIAYKYLDRVKRSGPENIVATCPFHTGRDGRPESNPSFAMNLGNGLYFCFSCNERGNLQTFLREVGVSRVIIDRHYKRLIDQLSTYRPKKLDPLRPKVFSVDPLPESTLGLFDACPLSLVKEGFDESLLQKHDIGFDATNQRITFPLRDLDGKLVGISGRTVAFEFPKYKVYDREYLTWGLPERHLEKGSVLWNANRVYPSSYFRKDPSIVLVEGFKACLWLIQHGIRDTVALLGTHLSQQHRWILERIGGEVYVMLDNDEWGRIGTARVASQLAVSLTVKVVEYPKEKHQPSDLSPQEIQDAMSSATDYYKWATEERNKWLLERIRPAWRK